MQLGGTQNITTPSNRVIPLFFTNGIPCMATEYPSDEDLGTLEIIVMNRDEPWTPQQHDHSHDDQWYNDTEHGEHEEQYLMINLLWQGTTKDSTMRTLLPTPCLVMSGTEEAIRMRRITKDTAVRHGLKQKK